MKLIVPYNMTSDSAVKLSNKLGLPLKRRTSDVLYGSEDIIINWGCTSMDVRGGVVLNPTDKVRTAVDKMSSLLMLQDNNVLCPVFTHSIDKANEWVSKGAVVFARTKLIGSGGEGIELLKRNSPASNTVWNCSLFTRGILDGVEYRVHVVGGKKLVQVKLKREGVESDGLVKNLANGFYYKTVETTAVVNCVLMAASQAINALGLDFGAVDIILKERKAFVLEVNTAPGIADEVLDFYVSSFSSLLNLSTSTITMEVTDVDDQSLATYAF